MGVADKTRGTVPGTSSALGVSALSAPLNPSGLRSVLPMLVPCPLRLEPPPIISWLALSHYSGPSLKALSIARSLLPTQSQLASLNPDTLSDKFLLYDFLGALITT